MRKAEGAGHSSDFNKCCVIGVQRVVQGKGGTHKITVSPLFRRVISIFVKHLNSIQTKYVFITTELGGVFPTPPQPLPPQKKHLLQMFGTVYQKAT